ncbi:MULTISPECIES: hypothetical protein [Psychrilyobacter]|uniref:PH domain-containing protein n=1 Tax=Psychrilyobacter piezotolerans TaxID=2293438 RepID=A0ABX9KEW1_9FUSO|nr:MULTISPECIES: hypothetical protein [Psychrilyobacter]MCS5423188.1 hypothetical protein [Psychrilyobacter sp. S5]NDI78746.1 hypothetical protein [Psychrilyobacter piezotolerans]RDE59595.1 hypothetical protein DV867_12595 [Psychrilyobacter sp. S5]REI40009.1 hypothetical protein DYH56_12595 [Psychrilyobacter piezotolerans]
MEDMNEIVNRILDEDKEIKNSSSGTNGTLTIEEFMEENYEVKKELEEGEEVRYIAYEPSDATGILRFIVPIYVCFLTACTFFIITSYTGNRWIFLPTFILFLLTIIFIMSMVEDTVIFTDKSLIIKRKKYSKKFIYSEIKRMNVNISPGCFSYSIYSDKEKIGVITTNYNRFQLPQILLKFKSELKIQDEIMTSKLFKIKILLIVLIMGLIGTYLELSSYLFFMNLIILYFDIILVTTYFKLLKKGRIKIVLIKKKLKKVT